MDLTGDDVQTRLEHLEALCAQQAADHRDLQARHDELLGTLARRSAVEDRREGSGSKVASSDAHRAGTSRRALLRKGAVALGVGVAGAAAAAHPAAAANGDPINAGEEATATSTTMIYTPGTGSLGGNVFNTADVRILGSIFPSALQGHSSGRRTSNGVYGSTSGATGSTQGYGLVGNASNRGTATRAPLYLVPNGGAPEGDSLSHLAGEIAVSGDGKLWYCRRSGTPGTWVELSATGPTVLNPAERAYDSRPGKVPTSTAPGAKGKFSAGETRIIDLDAVTSLPGSAGSVLANITIANTGGSGYLTAFNGSIADGDRPTASTMNWFTSNSQLANTTLVACNGAKQIKVFTFGGTDVIIDLLAWYPN